MTTPLQAFRPKLLFCPMFILSVACSPHELATTIKTDALNAVSSQLDKSMAPSTTLQVDANPWGSGFIVFGTYPASPDEVRIWFYYPVLEWSIPPSSKRDEIFALDESTHELTPRLPLLDAADGDLRHKIGFDVFSKNEVRETIVHALRQRTSLYDARQDLSRRSRAR